MHDYQIDAEGLVTKGNIVSPTTQNAPSIESETLLLASNLFSHAAANPEHMLLTIEILVRAHDPCLTCPAHFVELRRSDQRDN